MKKWLLPIVLLLWQSAVLAQQTASKTPSQEIYDEACSYLYGFGRSYDPPKAVQLFRKSAEMGFAPAFNALGNLYMKGEAGIEKNVQTAVSYYKRAGEAGYTPAYQNLATLYRNGSEVPQDFRLSAQYSKAGAEKGNAACKNLLAYYYFKGFGVQQSYEKAFQLYHELAQKGLANAQYFLGLCYRNGYGTQANEEEAKSWLMKAAAQADFQATHELTAEPAPENSSVYNPALQQQVARMKSYQERLIASPGNDISGTYQGFAVYYDFSGQFVHQVVPLTLSLKKTNGSYQGTWTEQDTLTASIKGDFSGRGFQFDPASQYTRHNYYSYRSAEKYQFQLARLNVNFIGDSVCLAGDMQFYSMDRKEPGQPMYIMLRRKVEVEGLASGSDLKLSVTPNPATSEVKATFTLPKATKVNLDIMSMDGKPVLKQAGDAVLPAGTYSVPVNVQQLVNGSYTLRITTATGDVQTKIFIKL
jgi:TPR repeat protein